MGTRSVVAEPQGDGWRGRYCHLDGYPSHQLAALRAIVQRDGVELALRRLTVERYGWLTIDPERTATDLRDGRTVNEPGYGIAFTTEQNQSNPDKWITHDGHDWCTEWAYVLSARAISVFQRRGWFGQSHDRYWHLVDVVRPGDELTAAALGALPSATSEGV